MLKRIILPVFALVSMLSYSQVTNKGYLVVKGWNMTIKNMDFHNQGTLDHKGGTIKFSGSEWVNDGTMVLQDPPTDAKTEFIGTSTQTIKGDNPNNFNNLIINAQDAVTQENEVVTNSMTVEDNGATYDYRVKDPGTDEPLGLPLTVNNDLTLEGKLRLYDDSQLIQKADQAVSGAGTLLRDQMGTGNKFWYNYWSSPVNVNGSWSLSHLQDGRNPDGPQPIVFEDDGSAEGSPNVNSNQNPAHINAYWIWKFVNGSGNDYDAWEQIKNTGTVNPGEGYTMKGPDIFNAHRPGASGTTEFKAYTFEGKPNNGTITLTITNGHSYLVGNPYPSALDADKFLEDNENVIIGTLIFWQHVDGDNHYLRQYVGGYAEYNSSGGNPAKDWQTGDSLDNAKIPQQYIPVGQGFFVERDSSASGDAQIVFQNSQRYFQKEDASASIFLRSTLTDIRLYFDDPRGLRRHLLLAIRPEATMGYDSRYDGPFIEQVYYGDMLFRIGQRDFVIQGIPELHRDIRLPLHVVMKEAGTVSFGVESLRNVPEGTEIYIEDTEQHLSHRIDLGQPYTTTLPEGDYTDRFVLAFRPADDLKNDELTLTDVTAHFNQGEIWIENPNRQHIQNVMLFDLNGKSVWHKNVNANPARLHYPADLATGVYMIKVTADGKQMTQKLIVD